MTPGRHFTLVELMIVVAIIAILAAIAIPSFVTMQLRAKRAEGPLNAEGIRTAQIAFEANADRFGLLDDAGYADFYVPRPGSQVDKVAVAWPGAWYTPDWDLVGWAPDGHVRCSYFSTPLGDNTDFDVRFTCNVDGDLASAAGGCSPCVENAVELTTSLDIY